MIDISVDFVAGMATALVLVRLLPRRLSDAMRPDRSAEPINRARDTTRDVAEPVDPALEAPRFEVETVDGMPCLGQFQQTLPHQADRYSFSYSNNEYGHSYNFEAVRQHEGPYDVLIRDQPGYGRRYADGHSTHRYSIGSAGQRICFAPGAEPRDLPDACRKAVFWADLTSRYIKFGERFE